MARVLHWVIVAAIVGQYVLAEVAEDSETKGVDGAMNAHYSFGITLLVLALVRLIWRLVQSPPATAPALKRYEVLAARTVHILFYGLLFVVPITGWLLATAEGHSVSLFGLFNLSLPATDGTLDKEQLEEVHEFLFNALVGLGVIHIVGALKHYFFDRGDVLHGMLPRRR